jgi:hypothetical protein
VIGRDDIRLRRYDVSAVAVALGRTGFEGFGEPSRDGQRPGDLDADTTGNGGLPTKISAPATTIRPTADLDPNITGAGGIHAKICERGRGRGDVCPVTSPHGRQRLSP